MDFSDRVVIVTGAAKGIGYAIAELFVLRNVKALVLLDINGSLLEEAAKTLQSPQTEIRTYVCDVSDEMQVNEVVSKALAAFGRVDVLVNNAGIYDTFDLFIDSKGEDWRRKFAVNVLGTMYMTRAVLDGMIANGYGRIINLASVAGV
ncbi:MAG: SDR family oxidoreductase, partial [Clostridia bacterium]